MVWIRPIIVEQSFTVYTGLFPEENGEINFKIYSKTGSSGAEPVVHCQGKALLISANKASALDIASLKSKCTDITIDSTECYKTFRSLSVDYGPGHRGVDKIYLAPEKDHTATLLTKLILPASIKDTENQYVFPND